MIAQFRSLTLPAPFQHSLFRKASAVSICLILLAGCSNKPKEPQEPQAAAPVETAPVTRKTIYRVITSEAVLYPVNQANIMPKINAPVKRFLVNRGDHVRQGQLLAVLEDRDLVAAANESKGLYEQAEANYRATTAGTMPEDLTKAQADLQSATEALDAARKVYESRETLYREGALARKLVDDAKVALVQARSMHETAKRHLESLETVSRQAQTEAAKAAVVASKAHYEGAAAQVSYAEVRSPISGVVSDRPLYEGEMASSSSALISIQDISEVVARANVPVQEAAAITTGNSATISGPGGKLDGKVIVVSPTVDPSTTTVQIWVRAKNTKERLRPGVNVQITIDAERIPNALVVPAAAILSLEEGGDKVMVAGTDLLAHERKVELGVRSGDNVQILTGVKEGEQVITVGGLGLEDKAKITIAKPEEVEDTKSGAEEK
jgi:multidrug efflux pump subunit AcrA (membrane-fusion protein)